MCVGREAFESVIPFGSEKNQCPLGLDVECTKCRFYEEKISA